jgi:hypothetical protein
MRLVVTGRGLHAQAFRPVFRSGLCISTTVAEAKAQIVPSGDQTTGSYVLRQPISYVRGFDSTVLIG